MVALAPFLASPGLPEQYLLLVDCALYAIGSVAAVYVTNDAIEALAVFLVVVLTPSVWRHIKTSRAQSNQDPDAQGVLITPPCIITNADAIPTKRTLALYIPVTLMWIATLWIVNSVHTDDDDHQRGEDELADDASIQWRCIRSVQLSMLLIGTWGHFAISRFHGDFNGGKGVPTYFAIMLHLAATMNGTSREATMSLHRILILYTYLMTGFRKAYVTGLRWADGKNLQLMIGIQGLYHDLDKRGGRGFNFALAEHRLLCSIGSIGVLGLQLLMPAFLLMPSATIFAAAFWFVMAFHAGNHILWRINFFIAWCPALLALLVLEPHQMSVAELSAEIKSGRAVAPLVIVIVYLIMQLGHALDKLSERLLERARRALLGRDADAHTVSAAMRPYRRSDNASPSTDDEMQEHHTLATLATQAGLYVIWALEMHCLGDYYTHYWPEMHPHRAVPVACVVVKWKNGDEHLLPCPSNFYWRREVNAWLLWPRTLDEKECLLARNGDGESPNGAKGKPRADQLSIPLKTVVARLQKQFEVTFFPLEMLQRTILKSGGRVYIRNRELRYDGTALRVHRLWDLPIPFPAATDTTKTD